MAKADSLRRYAKNVTCVVGDQVLVQWKAIPYLESILAPMLRLPGDLTATPSLSLLGNGGPFCCPSSPPTAHGPYIHGIFNNHHLSCFVLESQTSVLFEER